MRRLLFLALLLALSMPPAGSWAQDPVEFVWERYDVALDVQQDGKVRVTETQQIRYTAGQPSGRGGRRVPFHRLGGITDVRVSEIGLAGERPLTARTSTEKNELRITWFFVPGEVGELRTFKVQYVVDEVIRVYPDAQQVWWIAIPSERRAAINQSVVTLRLPGNISPEQLKVDSYPSRLGGIATAVQNGADFSVQDIPPDQGFEVRAEFPAGTTAATAPAWQAEADREDIGKTRNIRRLVITVLVYAVGAPVLAVVALLIWWRTRRSEGPQVTKPTTPRSSA